MSTTEKKRRYMIITTDETLIEQIRTSNPERLIDSLIFNATGISSNNSPTIESEPPKKKKTPALTCVVCGSTANGYNFDAISCESCKAFFRRNALKETEIGKCRRDGQCKITLESRRRCSACRLKKCLENGMRVDRLLTAEQKAEKLKKTEQNRLLTSLNKLTDGDQAAPLLTSSMANTPSDRNLLLLDDVTDLLPNSCAAKQPPNLLTQEDLERVDAIQLSYEQRIELAAREGLPWNPTVHGNTLLQHLNGRSVQMMRLISFFKQIPEFNELNVSDRITLIKYNLMPLGILNCTLFYKSGIDQMQESESDAPWDSKVLIQVHGQELYLKVKKVFESFVRIAQYDPRIVQLALIVLILTKGFSPNSTTAEPILNDGMAVYRAQNYYTELLWKYLEVMHGREKAIQIFNDLVTHFISWQMLQGELRASVHSKLTPTEIDDLLPIMKSLLHVP